MNDRYLHPVTCKAALYTPDGAKVLLTAYEEQRYGLPGGHIEANETPDQAIHRELYEELGLENVKVQHYDFWMHSMGKVVLGYVGTLDEQTPLSLQLEEVPNIAWVRVNAIKDGTVAVRSYGDFIVAAQPKN